ncbi:MAG: hypothetical protein ACKOCK_03530 [Chloroflexota bacterium]
MRMLNVVGGLTMAGLLSLGLVAGVGAQEVASGGNGGGSNADSNGGSISIGTIDDGGSAGLDIAALVAGAVAAGDDIAATVIAALTQ